MKYNTIWTLTGHGSGWESFRAEIDVWELGKQPLEDGRRILRKVAAICRCSWSAFEGQAGFDEAVDNAIRRAEARRADLNAHDPDELGMLDWFWQERKDVPRNPKDRENLHEQLWAENAKRRQRLHKLKDYYKTLI